MTKYETLWELPKWNTETQSEQVLLECAKRFAQWRIATKLSFAENTVSVQFSSVAQLCPTLWDPMDCSTPGLPVHHQLLMFTQTHIHWVGDAIQPSHPLSSPFPPTFNLSQHQGLFKWVRSLHQEEQVSTQYIDIFSSIRLSNIFGFHNKPLSEKGSLCHPCLRDEQATSGATSG